MTVEAIIATQGTNQARRIQNADRRRVGQFGAILSHESEEDQIATDAIPYTHASSSVNTVLSLNTIHTEHLVQQKRQEYGQNLIGQLKQLHKEVLLGDLSKQQSLLQQLRTTIMNSPEFSHNAALEETLQAIELRTAVEIAKRQARNS